jgi:hypothetical protein
MNELKSIKFPPELMTVETNDNAKSFGYRFNQRMVGTQYIPPHR